MSEITYSNGSQEITFKDQIYVIDGQEMKFRTKDLTYEEIQYGHTQLDASHQQVYWTACYLGISTDEATELPASFFTYIWEKVSENIETYIERETKRMEGEIKRMEKEMEQSRIHSRLEILDIRKD